MGQCPAHLENSVELDQEQNHGTWTWGGYKKIGEKIRSLANSSFSGDTDIDNDIVNNAM